ncbi:MULTISPECIES: hypothetical protein [Peribacillus]|uniref:hypothetical protein n=1 Tax=Peribacillus TaxID=2675229 RepID=UPI001F4E166B|nr:MULTISPECIES: hypothetical protein [unclassified Peribacillus]MCK1985199.1 hypothetical protein [Peribacillus sp. Aquil_B1]MCK2007151.1 hypothetical protein [Peribacillus sp. Aquil_B8]
MVSTKLIFSGMSRNAASLFIRKVTISEKPKDILFKLISIFNVKIPASVPYNWIEEIPQDACFDGAWQAVGKK